MIDNLISVLLTITDSYVPYCGVTMTSLFENNRNNKLCVYVFCPNLSDSNKKLLHNVASRYGQQIIFPIAAVRNNMPLSSQFKFHESVLYRLYVSHLIPKEVGRIIYMDCDLIVTDDLREMWNRPMDSSISLWAVPDLFRFTDYYRLKLNHKKHTYFNAGVILINLDYWRKNQVGEKCLDYIKKNAERVSYLDQDALNAVLAGTVKYLHPRYNCMIPFYANIDYLKNRVWYEDLEHIHEAVNAPCIIHYVGAKPWSKQFLPPYKGNLDVLSIYD